MSSTRDQRIRRAPSKSPKKSDKSKTGSPKASGSGSTKDTNFFTVTSTTTTSTYPANKLSLGGNIFAGSDFPMTAAFRGSSIDTDFGGQQISSVRVTTRLRNTKSLQVTRQLEGPFFKWLGEYCFKNIEKMDKNCFRFFHDSVVTYFY